ncbi:LuxR family transcriptional regulator [Streptomyces spiroverticillatus]|uniref:LuxR family transcriptional regulator n=1 Tax=Streptomyces finlayi TaxID=67296 RepID=A0A918X467_9ACTN|nr:LuxR family transcriptional regulator [Streptomyces finlayi]GHA27463.1 LuxR family transcriptional regulator [Streptomyces spiroverticillatus]GHD08582.1 LuxR family transcriptional regulator [Streptomyces finlayi]
MSTTPSRPLLGRHDEIARLLALVGAAEQGRGGVLVLRGEPGIGKTALVEHVGRAAPEGFQVIRASGAEFEGELPFAALHQLCVPVLAHLDTLAPAYRDALLVAFGLSDGTPDAFRVGLAALQLLATAAAQRPVLCLVDDAHWMDAASAEALTFLARRVAAEPIAVVFAARDSDVLRGLDDLPGLTVGGLSDAHAQELLAEEKTVTLDERVRDRLLAEARGNPLALIELPKAGGFAPPTPSPVAGRIERSFAARLGELPPEAQMLLILASADPTGDPGLLWPAAQLLGLGVPAASAAAETSGLVRFGTRTRFCHPLARSAAYRTAEPGQLRSAHRALADATDPVAAPDRRAWHRAQATTGPDERVAAELESSASRAQARGGVSAGAAFLERAAELSLDPAKQSVRVLAAARATLAAGRADAAGELLTSMDTASLDELQHASVELLRGQIAFSQGSDRAVRGPELILRAARRFAVRDPERARECFVAALEMGLAVGQAAGVMGRVLEAARTAPPSSKTVDLLDALVLLHSEGHRAGVPVLRQALAGDGDGDSGAVGWTRAPALATVLAGELWDLDLHAGIVAWLVRTGRDSGSPMTIRLGLSQLALSTVFTGEFGRAMDAIAEEEAVADAVGDLPQLYPRVHLAALRGRRQEVLDLFTELTSRPAGQLTGNAHWATAVLYNGLADYPAALAAARRAVAGGDLFLTGIALPELVEAAVRCGESAAAESALGSLVERTEPAGTPFALGVAAGARALVSDAEDDHREAIEHLTGSSLVPHLARAQLRYGEWLRRAGRRRDAREQLRAAHGRLAGTGMEAFARRAADELRATGEVARSRSGHTYDSLTMQETHIARQVAAGATTKEVAGRLFLSPRTVDAHLRNIFRKLGITSRRQLRDMPDLR